ncbi:MAG: hypothetical protein R3293_12460 [Candidatus Promineifilaceae bacterium]|nr:hypothetical protein [Candidatus Promineifilaceae bacterium]
MIGKEPYHHSQLFTIRVWQPDDGDDRTEWRGKLRHVPSGEVRYFRGWAALIPLMLDMLRRHNDPRMVDKQL